MRIHRRRRLECSLQTAPLADVSLLLIIFFVVTSVFAVGKGIDLGLPPEPDRAVEVGEDAVDIHVLADGSLVVDRKPLGLGELLPYLGRRLAANPDKPVILRTEPLAPYGAMVAVLDELRTAPETAGFEVTNLAIPTQREIQGAWLDLGWAGD